ncbi:MAG: mechanosensitive ion channel family protein [Mariniblastus sp.]
MKLAFSLLRWVATRAIILPVFIFGVYLVLRVSGLTQLALTVLGGTGLIGWIIGIAFQDIAENFLASISISVQKPFRIGDLVVVDGHEGVVQRVTTRGTTLLTADENHVQIPNSKIYKTTIENYTANPLRRISFIIGIGYDDSTSEAQTVVLETIKSHTATLNDPAPRFLIQDLGASTVNLTALCWIDGTKNDLRSVRSSCMRMAKQALLKAGISMPDEAREVIFPNGVPVMMDAKDSQDKNVEASAQALDANSTASKKDNAELPSGEHCHPNEEAMTEAEGHMASDLEDLKRQAKTSWLPGEGEEVLVGEE